MILPLPRAGQLARGYLLSLSDRADLVVAERPPRVDLRAALLVALCAPQVTMQIGWGSLPQAALQPKAPLTRRRRHFRKVPEGEVLKWVVACVACKVGRRHIIEVTAPLRSDDEREAPIVIKDQSVLPRTIEALAEATYPSFALQAGMELDIFTPLKDGPLDAVAVARAAATDPAKTEQLLHSLVSIGLMQFDGSRFSNCPEADRYLVRGKADYIGMRHHAYRRRWESMLRVADTIRTGTPQRGMDYAAMSSELRESFYRGTFTECLAAGRELATRIDFSKYHRLVDVGGGSGGISIAMAEAWPHLSITIADLPSTAPVAERYISEAGFKSRIQLKPTNLVTGKLEGTYDVAIMRGLIPVLTPDQIRGALKNVHQVLEPGCPLYVVGWILDDTRSTPLSYATYNLLFVNDYENALIHTETEHRSWLAEAGFADITRDRESGTYAADFMVARKA
jgi:hypothetical protein